MTRFTSPSIYAPWSQSRFQSYLNFMKFEFLVSTSINQGFWNGWNTKKKKEKNTKKKKKYEEKEKIILWNEQLWKKWWKIVMDQRIVRRECWLWLDERENFLLDQLTSSLPFFELTHFGSNVYSSQSSFHHHSVYQVSLGRRENGGGFIINKTKHIDIENTTWTVFWTKNAIYFVILFTLESMNTFLFLFLSQSFSFSLWLEVSRYLRTGSTWITQLNKVIIMIFSSHNSYGPRNWNEQFYVLFHSDSEATFLPCWSNSMMVEKMKR